MIARRESMSGVDLAWLRMEQPTNPMTIVGVLTLRGKMTVTSVRAALAKQLAHFPRFRQLPVHDVMGSYWQDDPHFDLDSHVHSLPLPPRAGQRQLEGAVSKLASTPLDPRRPLWQIHVVERYRGGSALIVRFHHCYADGMALLQVLLSLTRTRSGRHGTHSKARTPGRETSMRLPQLPLLGPALELAQDAARLTGNVIGIAMQTLAHPQQSLAMATKVAAATRELATIALLEDDPPTALRGPLSTCKQVAWADPIPLSEVKTIAKVLGCTVNDALLATVAGVLGSYLRSRGKPLDGVVIRALVPVNLRGPKSPELGNQFGLVFVNLPLGERNPIARIFAVHAHMETLKSSVQPTVVLWALAALGALPAAIEKQAVDLLTAKATAVISNVPGPQEPLYFGEARIDRLFFWVPQAGSIGIGVSMLTYDGRVHFGLMADRNLIAQPQAVVRNFGREFEKLLLCTLSVVD